MTTPAAWTPRYYVVVGRDKTGTIVDTLTWRDDQPFPSIGMAENCRVQRAAMTGPPHHVDDRGGPRPVNPYDRESRTADVGGAALTFTLECLPTGRDRPHDYVVRVHRTVGTSTTLVYVQAHGDETRARADANRTWARLTDAPTYAGLLATGLGGWA